MYSPDEIRRTVIGLRAKALPAEQDGHLSAARHMINAAEMLEAFGRDALRRHAAEIKELRAKIIALGEKINDVDAVSAA